LIRNEYGPAENTADLKNNAEDKEAKRSWMNYAAHWKTYAAAAGAKLAMATNASADIVNSGLVDVTVSIPSSGDHTSMKPFTVAGYGALLVVGNISNTKDRKAIAGMIGSFGVRASFFPLGGTPFLYRYNTGQNITGTDHVPGGYLRGAAGRPGTVTATIGSFGPETATGFVGFKLRDGDLGWMQVKVSSTNGFPDEAEVIDYAYNSVPGGAVAAGQTTVPEPSAAALGLLTIGAAGLLAWRRRRAEVSAK